MNVLQYRPTQGGFVLEVRVDRTLRVAGGLGDGVEAGGPVPASGILVDVVTKPTWRRRAVQRYARLSLRAQVIDRELRDKLTPDYQPLCTRQVLSGTYYRALSADNAELVTEPIERIDHGDISHRGRPSP